MQQAHGNKGQYKGARQLVYLIRAESPASIHGTQANEGMMLEVRSK
jgi:hypothetical protein